MQAEVWARFLDNVELDSPCAVWIGAKSKAGYGQLYVDGKVQYAHRLAYEHFYGEISLPKMYVRHLCGNPACVRFVHLACGTPSQNRWDLSDEARRKIAADAWVTKGFVKLAKHTIKMRASRTPEGIRIGALKMTAARMKLSGDDLAAFCMKHLGRSTWPR